MATRVAVLDDYQQVALEFADWSALEADCEVQVFHEPFADADAAAAALRGFEVVCAMRERTPFPAALLQRLPRLKLLVTTGMRNASIDVAAAARQGVTVCGTQGSAQATAELTWGLIIALLRRIPAEHASMAAGGWQTTVGTDLAGARLGVIGLGRLGSRVARVGNAFDMDVVAWSPNLTEERAREGGAKLVGKHELMATSDIVTVHMVLSARTRGLIGAAELAAMQPTAILVNTARGPIVDEAALLEALREGRIAGAGLDVYGTEPLPADDPLRGLPNVVLTPHLGYVTRATYETFYRQTVECVRGFLDGAPVRVIEAG